MPEHEALMLLGTALRVKKQPVHGPGHLRTKHEGPTSPGGGDLGEERDPRAREGSISSNCSCLTPLLSKFGQETYSHFLDRLLEQQNH